MSEPAAFALPASEVAALAHERESAQAAAAQIAADAPAPEVGAGQGAELGPAPPVLTGKELRPLIGLANLAFSKLGAEEITERESALWCDSAAPVLNAHGGALPFMPEITLVLVTAVVFGPRCHQAYKAMTAPPPPAQPAKEAA